MNKNEVVEMTEIKKDVEWIKKDNIKQTESINGLHTKIDMFIVNNNEILNTKADKAEIAMVWAKINTIDIRNWKLWIKVSGIAAVISLITGGALYLL